MKEIPAIGTWANNAEMILDVARLGYLKGRVLDMTYGTGGFWTIHQPPELVTNDVDPSSAALFHYDCRLTPWLSCSFGTVVFDPPYRLAGTPTLGAMDTLYGTGEVASRNERLCLLVAGIAEGCRLTRDLLLVKVMDQINGGRYVDMVQVASDAARAVEMHKVATLLLPGGGRKQPPGTSQQHPRNDYSSLLVFGKKTR